MPQIQRARLLTAAVAVVDELGCGEASVARITSRAGVSRRTFYEIFEYRDECLLAVLQRAAGQASERVAAELAESGSSGWREQVRLGLWAILDFLDSDPVLARVCIVQLQHASGIVQSARLEILELLATVLDEGRDGVQTSAPSALTAQGLIGGIVAILQGQLAERTGQPLGGLLGELMAMIVLPYLGPAAARRERQLSLPATSRLGQRSRGAAVAPDAEQLGAAGRVGSERRNPAPARTVGAALAAASQPEDPLARLPMRLTYRTVQVLQSLAENQAGCVGLSNREIGERAGIGDQGQISKLLGRLERLGLVVNDQAGAATRGEPNRWSLTPGGTRLIEALGAYERQGEGRRR